MVGSLDKIARAVTQGAEKARQEQERARIEAEDKRVMEAALAALPQASQARARTGVKSAFDASRLKKLIDQGTEAAVRQSGSAIDFATEQAVEQLERNQEEARGLFDTQRRQTELEAAQASDSSALYAQLRGDRGGIGRAQYDSISNQAAANHLLISQAQSKLATDTARQITALRAQGEFEEADAALRLSQERLSQLISLEQWAARFGLDEYQLQSQISRWEAEMNAAALEKERSYSLDLARLAGSLPDGSKTLAGQSYADEQAAKLLESLIRVGITPTAAQVMSALGLSEEEARQYASAAAMQIAAAKKGGSGGGKGGSSGSGGSSNSGGAYESVYQQLYDAGVRSVGGAYDYLMNKLGYSVTATKQLSEHYMSWFEEQAQEGGDHNAAQELERYLFMAATLPREVYRRDFLRELYSGGQISRNQMQELERRLGMGS